MPDKIKADDFTDKEAMVLIDGWMCFLTQPKLDWVKLTMLLGYKNIGSTKNTYYSAKKKVDRFIREAFDAAQPEEPAAAAVKGEKKRVFQADEDDELPAPKMVKKTPAQSSAEI
ncbi:hypothetical protein F4824DRAFT_98340 [Ustulina deusta]|nr:hypothetical protein F4824DRAFT_98340 [Ustulina deusta]